MKEYFEFILPILGIILFMVFGPSIIRGICNFIDEYSFRCPWVLTLIKIALVIIALLICTLEFLLGNYEIVIMPK